MSQEGRRTGVRKACHCATICRHCARTSLMNHSNDSGAKSRPTLPKASRSACAMHEPYEYTHTRATEETRSMMKNHALIGHGCCDRKVRTCEVPPARAFLGLLMNGCNVRQMPARAGGESCSTVALRAGASSCAHTTVNASLTTPISELSSLHAFRDLKPEGPKTVFSKGSYRLVWSTQLYAA